MNDDYLNEITHSDAARLTNKTSGKFSWLNTPNSKRVLDAIDSHKETVELENVSWSTFSISFNNDRTRVYICPAGNRPPFGPVAWIDVEKLREDVGSK